MYVVMVASECSPVIQVGGLADVVAGLSRELETAGGIGVGGVRMFARGCL